MQWAVGRGQWAVGARGAGDGEHFGGSPMSFNSRSGGEDGGNQWHEMQVAGAGGPEYVLVAIRKSGPTTFYTYRPVDPPGPPERRTEHEPVPWEATFSESETGSTELSHRPVEIMASAGKTLNHKGPEEHEGEAKDACSVEDPCKGRRTDSTRRTGGKGGNQKYTHID